MLWRKSASVALLLLVAVTLTQGEEPTPSQHNAAFHKKWNAIPVPAKTPFDDVAKKRTQYLGSYRDGYFFAQGTHWWCPASPNDHNSHAIRGFVEGWQAGVKAGGTSPLPSTYAPFLAWRQPPGGAGVEISDRDDLPQATRVIEGRQTTFPEKALAEGVKATVAVLQSCHHVSDGTVDDLNKARKGDHVCMVFAKPTTVTVLGKTLEVSEAVFADGVFWLRCGEDVVRCTKYEYDKWDRFLEWSRQTLPAE